MIWCLAFEGKDFIKGKNFDLKVLAAAREHLFENTKERFTTEIRKLIYSKLMRKPLQIMKYKVKMLLNEPQEKNTAMEKVKMMIYSAHDTQVQNILSWLAPTNHTPKNVPFGS